MRFPGTGEGVARLVLVSIVKVDMARPSNGAALTPPVGAVSDAQRRELRSGAKRPPIKCDGHWPACVEIDDDF
jgi:hypothetical protein